MLLGVSLDRVSQSGWMLWQTAALCSGQRGVGRDWLCSMERGCYLRSVGPGGVGVQGLAANTPLHWHGMRDTRGSPATTETRGRLRGGRAGNANPRAVSDLPGQDSRDCGILCRNVTLHVRVFESVCVFRFSINEKATTRRKLINFKIWNREQVNKIHGKMWLIVWIPYIKSQHIYPFSFSIKTLLMDKSSMHCISGLVILNPMKTHLFTTERTIWRVEHAVSF